MNLQRLIERYVTFRLSLGDHFQTQALWLRAFGRRVGRRTDVAAVRPEQVNAFLAGAGPLTRTWHHKYSVLLGFFRYAISRGHTATAPLPAVTPKEPPPFVPYVFSQEDLRRLLRAIDTDPRRSTSMAPTTLHAIVLLLYGAGLRVREAVQLDRADVDWDNSLLVIRQTKFRKTRLVPFGPPLKGVLTRYDAQARPAPAEAPFFRTRAGGRVNQDTLERNFRFFCSRAGVRRVDGARFQPRLHDLRHTFAVHRLTSWYRQGADVQKLLPQLSVYLGHVRVACTQVYLSMTPELLAEANARFERYLGKEGCHG